MAYSASASAKTILFGEHAVVYNNPAIAIPLHNARTTVTFEPSGEEFRVFSDAIRLDSRFEELNDGSGLKSLLKLLQDELGIEHFPAETLRIETDIPIASGLGSGAALSIAVIRLFSDRYGANLTTERINELAYEIEKIYHGKPSGIDNTTIAYEQPVLFSKLKGFKALEADIARLPLLVIDSGIRSRTVDVVMDVYNNFARNENAIRQIGGLVRKAESALKTGTAAEIGALMDENQSLLRQIDVSCPELDHWIDLAKQNGAVGAKLTGAGRGGNFLVMARDHEHLSALRELFKEQGLNVIT